MAYTLGNKYAKNLCKRTVLLQLIIKNVVTYFLEHSVDVGVYIDGSFDRQQQIYVRVVERRLLTPSHGTRKRVVVEQTRPANHRNHQVSYTAMKVSQN